jgi:hypothetical protein
MIGYRTRILRYLREQDYAEFEKILSSLKISYQIPKQPDHVKTRKAWSLFTLRQRVDAEKVSFFGVQVCSTLDLFQESKMEALRLEYEKNKDSKLKELNSKLDDLAKQQEDVQKQLLKLKMIEAQVPVHVDGKYQPKLVEELTETAVHSLLFYHPPPNKKAA